MRGLAPQTSELFDAVTRLDCILKSGVDIHELIPLALEHSDHKLKSKNLLAMITNGEAYSKDIHFDALCPVYDVTPYDIQEYIKQKLLENKL